MLQGMSMRIDIRLDDEGVTRPIRRACVHVWACVRARVSGRARTTESNDSVNVSWEQLPTSSASVVPLVGLGLGSSPARPSSDR